MQTKELKQRYETLEKKVGTETFCDLLIEAINDYEYHMSLPIKERISIPLREWIVDYMEKKY